MLIKFNHLPFLLPIKIRNSIFLSAHAKYIKQATPVFILFPLFNCMTV